MNIAICDDDVSHISYITDLLTAYRREKMFSLRWTSFTSGFALLAALDRGDSFDAVLLDIYMNDMNGMEVAKRIRAMNNSMHIVLPIVSIVVSFVILLWEKKNVQCIEKNEKSS